MCNCYNYICFSFKIFFDELIQQIPSNHFAHRHFTQQKKILFSLILIVAQDYNNSLAFYMYVHLNLTTNAFFFSLEYSIETKIIIIFYLFHEWYDIFHSFDTPINVRTKKLNEVSYMCNIEHWKKKSICDEWIHHIYF